MKSPSILNLFSYAGLAVASMGAPLATPAGPATGIVLETPADRLGIHYNQLPKPSESKVAATSWPCPLQRPTDLPADTVWLEPFYVSESREKLTEEKVLSDKGRLELALKRHISPAYRATFGPLSQLAAYYFCWPSILGGWHPNEAEAMTLYRQEKRLKMLDEMDDLIRLETLADPKAAKDFQRIRFGAEVTSR